MTEYYCYATTGVSTLYKQWRSQWKNCIKGGIHKGLCKGPRTLGRACVKVQGALEGLVPRSKEPWKGLCQGPRTLGRACPKVHGPLEGLVPRSTDPWKGLCLGPRTLGRACAMVEGPSVGKKVRTVQSTSTGCLDWQLRSLSYTLGVMSSHKCERFCAKGSCRVWNCP